MKFITRNWIAFLLCTLSFGCAAPAEKPGHNDPSKYTLAPNVLWTSPDGFDLSMDIYTPTSAKDSYPVLMIFHGGGWLINDKSIMDQAAKSHSPQQISLPIICAFKRRFVIGPNLIPFSD